RKMNMSERPFTTPEILDVTEVEKAKLHEDGETERVRVREVATTRRKFIEEITGSVNKLTSNDGFYVALVIIPLITVIGTCIVLASYISDRYGKPSPCVDSINIISASSNPELCAPGAS